MADKLMTEIQEDFLTCSLCLKPYQHPKALPCLHSFCKHCLDEHLRSNAIKAANDGVRCIFCPICRQVAEVPGSGVDGFHDNYLLKSLLDMAYSRVLQTCDVCKEEGKRCNAAYCCIKCEDFLCDDCSVTHKRTRVTRDHLVINVSMVKDVCLGKHVDKKICVRLLTKIGSFGANLYNPISIATNQADDIIVSNNNDMISIFNQGGECKKEIQQRLFYGLERNFLPNRGIAVTTEGFIAVAMRKDMTGNLAYVGVVATLAERQAGLFGVKTRSPKDCIPHGIATTPDNYTIITDVGKHCFYIFNSDMELSKQVGKRGSKNSQFKSPFFVAVNTKREILVSDYDNHCIKVFDIRGKYKRQFGEMGRELGQLMHPMGLCSDDNDNMFVCDRDNHRVQMFDADGKFLTVVCHNTCRDGNDVRPQDVTMTTNGHLVVLVKGVEGVDFAEIHVLQVGTRFTEDRGKTEEAKGHMAMLRESLDFLRKPAPSQKASVLPPLGREQQSPLPSAPPLHHVAPPPDLLTPSNQGHRYGHRSAGVNMDSFPHSQQASALCNIL